MTNKNEQLANLLKDNTSKTVLKEVKKIYTAHYPGKSFKHIESAHMKIIKLFQGKFPGYRACNTEYHDLEHTEEVFLASARLIDGCNLGKIPIEKSMAKNILLGALFHDTGYIQKEGENEGTGAKYTQDHVDRGIVFLEDNYKQFDISTHRIGPVSRIIQSTEFSMDFELIPYLSQEENLAGMILGTADLLGQMANRAYLEKLLFLYYEFREAQIPGYHTEFDILRKTVGFYQFTKKRLAESFQNIHYQSQYHFRDRFGIDRDLYMEAIDRHLAYLDTIIRDESSNFRHKLKRGEWDESGMLMNTKAG
ncbi:MAG: HD domain-containing protein [bacterium]|nr:HD domain-containing protein [bacterium]